MFVNHCENTVDRWGRRLAVIHSELPWIDWVKFHIPYISTVSVITNGISRARYCADIHDVKLYPINGRDGGILDLTTEPLPYGT